MEKVDLKGMTDKEIAKLWNDLAVCFEVIKSNRPRAIVVGFFELSKETDRRGMQMGKDKFGRIILEPKPVPVIN